MGRTTADPVRRRLHALTGSAGALLLEELLAGVLDLGAGLGLRRAGATLRELAAHDLVKEVLADLDVEDDVGQRERADLLAVHVVDVNHWHGRELLNSCFHAHRPREGRGKYHRPPGVSTRDLTRVLGGVAEPAPVSELGRSGRVMSTHPCAFEIDSGGLVA